MFGSGNLIWSNGCEELTQGEMDLEVSRLLWVGREGESADLPELTVGVVEDVVDGDGTVVVDAVPRPDAVRPGGTEEGGDATHLVPVSQVLK